MAFISIENVRLDGICSSAPKERVSLEQKDNSEEIVKLIKSTGIRERRIVEGNTCTSDLCYTAAEKLIAELNWQRNEIGALIFVTQTPDYILPATSPLLQSRLGLSSSCLALDISLGCSGYVYGLTTISNFLSNGSIKKALLLVGDTISKTCSPNDRSTFPLFGDAGSATALSFDSSAPPIYANLCSDGSGFESIIIKDGGYRNPYNSSSTRQMEFEKGISRNNCQLALNGMDVFSFGISRAPEVVNDLLSHFNLKKEAIDYFVFHQANLFMNEKIRKKLSLPVEKVPYSLGNFGNTSCTTIPLTINIKLSEQIRSQDLGLILCGFGVGLSWGAVYINTSNIVSPDLIEI